MSRRKQSNPKPLKSESHEKLSTTSASDFEEKEPEDLRKGESEEWGAKDANSMETDESSDHHESRSTPECDKNFTPSAVPKEEKSESGKSNKSVEDGPRLRLRLKTNLATDPALQPLATAVLPNIKHEREIASSPNASEYFASLPPSLQSVIANGRFFLPSHLTIPETPVRVEPAEVSARQNSVPVYLCVPCSIKFSSLSTLEAHQTYYCSHRANKNSTSDAEDVVKTTPGTENNGNQSDQDVSENASKAIRTGKQYTCNQCSYSADKKVSLNRHMRMHTVSPSSINAVSNGDNAAHIDNHDRYCADCDISFSSQKTYRAHKLHYCGSRHVNKPSQTANLSGSVTVTVGSKTTSSCTSGSTSTSPIDTSTCRTPPSPSSSIPSQQPLLALPTNPILIVPYSVFRAASLIPGIIPNVGGLPTPDTPCFLLPNGTLQPMSQALPAGSVGPPQITEVLKNANKVASVIKEPNAIRDPSAPLDLSVRKSPQLKDVDIRLDDQEKENIKQRSPTPEQIICAPSLHGSPPLTPSSLREPSPIQITSPKRKYDHDSSRSNSPRTSRLTPKAIASLDAEKLQLSPDGAKNLSSSLGIPPALHPLLLRAGPLLPPELQIRLATGEVPPITATAPQVLVKQGVSKCKECNIVFCKHENYVVHKKHYCSSRLQEEEVSKNSGSPPVSPGSASATSPAGQYQQLICLACGIKFTSLDNLNAHQAYYCLKRGDIELRRCGKCRGIAEPGHHCATPSNFPGWKCPCCDVVSATASAAQRHMETHNGVKAYRCTICRYKGNTLRGMRTHIRVHFEKRSPDLQEEKYISCILEDDGANVVETSMTAAMPLPNVTDDRSVSPSSEGHSESLHHCAQCSYSSAYKANVLRHVKLVHGAVAADEEQLSNGVNDRILKTSPVIDPEEVVIKKEVLDVDTPSPKSDSASKEKIDVIRKDDAIKQEIDQASSLPKDDETSRYCDSCNITFNYYSTYVAHKKFYCSSHAGEVTNSTTNNNNSHNRTAETSVL